MAASSTLTAKQATCPKCGAPLLRFSTNQCEYCGSVLDPSLLDRERRRITIAFIKAVDKDLYKTRSKWVYLSAINILLFPLLGIMISLALVDSLLLALLVGGLAVLGAMILMGYLAINERNIRYRRNIHPKISGFLAQHGMNEVQLLALAQEILPEDSYLIEYLSVV